MIYFISFDYILLLGIVGCDKHYHIYMDLKIIWWVNLKNFQPWITPQFMIS